MDKRRYARHPADVPIRVAVLGPDEPAPLDERLSDIGLGGLSFESTDALNEGAMLAITMPSVIPAFQIKGRVVWCHRSDGRFDVGVEFTEPEKLFKARMVEQICHIEHYRNEVMETEGRNLSGEEAAREWIEMFADEFPGD